MYGMEGRREERGFKKPFPRMCHDYCHRRMTVSFSWSPHFNASLDPVDQHFSSVCLFLFFSQQHIRLLRRRFSRVKNPFPLFSLKRQTENGSKRETDNVFSLFLVSLVNHGLRHKSKSNSLGFSSSFFSFFPHTLFFYRWSRDEFWLMLQLDYKSE